MLAQSARRGGYRTAVIDLFNDLDTRRYASCSLRVAGRAGGFGGFDARALMTGVATLGDSPYAGIVYGSGLEDSPDLLIELGQHGPLYGNGAETVALMKDPQRFFPLLDELSIPHPELAYSAPAEPRGWLAKSVGGSGGAHVRCAVESSGDLSGTYYQRRIEGVHYSVSFLANGRSARVLGLNQPWTVALGDWPFCYGGAISRVAVPAVIIDAIQSKLDMLVARSGLLGLNGMDFALSGAHYSVIEVNPRPSGTLDLYDADCPEGLFHWHLRACEGELPERVFTRETIRAHAVVYAPRPFSLPPSMAWPDWCSDIPQPDTVFEARMPICMVHAEGLSHDQTKTLIHDRREKILTDIFPP
jgi:uncharacterized protein